MMRSYLKYRPAWVQLVIFLLFAFGLLAMAGMAGSVLVAKLNGLSLDEMSQIIDGTKLNHPAARNVIAGSQIVQFLAVFMLPSFLFAWMADPRPLQFAGIRPPHSNRHYTHAVLLVFCSLYLVGCLALLNKHIPLPQYLVDLENKQNDSIKVLAMAANIQQLIGSILLVGVLAALGEELFFRSILQRIFIQLFKSPWAGIIVTAAFFSAIHMQFSGFLPRMALGIALGALYWYSGSIWPGVLFHFLYNSLGVIMAYANPSYINKDSPVEGQTAIIYTLGGISIGLVAYLMLQMKKHSKTEWTHVYDTREPTPFDNKA